MTQAFNLAQLANNLNTSGQLDATDGLVGSVPVANGGTGRSSLTANNVILGNGTGAVQQIAPGTSGNVLTSNGTTWASSLIAAIGVGQTWQAVTRTSNVSYTNSTGKPIMLIRYSISSGNANTGADISIAGGAFFTFMFSGSNFGPASACGGVIIPVGVSYTVRDFQPGTITTFELR